MANLIPFGWPFGRIALLLLSIACPFSVRAQSIPPGQARQALDVLRDPARRAQVSAALEAIVRAAPAAAPASASAAAPALSAAPSAVIPLAPDSLGAEIVDRSAAWLGRFSDQLRHANRIASDLPLLWRWTGRLLHEPVLRGRALDAAARTAAVLACAWTARAALSMALRRPARAVAARAATAAPSDAPVEIGGETEAAAHHHRRLGGAWRLLRRLPLVLGLLALDLAPVAAFVATGLVLSGTALAGPPVARAAIGQMLDASASFLLAMVATRLLARPRMPSLRLVRMSDEGARRVEAWVRQLAGLLIFGAACGQVAVSLGLSRAAQLDVFRLLMLVAHLRLIGIVLQSREAVARRLRPRRGAGRMWAAWLRRLAESWHWIAIFYLVASWLVWASQTGNGFARLLHFLGVTVPVLVAGRLAAILLLGGLYRAVDLESGLAARHPALRARAARYLPALRIAVSSGLWLATLVVLLQCWGWRSFAWFGRGDIGGRLLSACGVMATTAALAAIGWEGVNAAMERQAERLAQDGQAMRVARLHTLMPILRTALLVSIVAVAGLTILSEIGVNIAPLLAGAGILGVALGFGSQKLVQDLITGLFLLLENAMQVGDSITVAGLSGTVEHLSIRTIRLRASDGSVHIVPFSAVTSVTNTNRGAGNAAIGVTVAYDQDTDAVCALLRAIADELLADPAYSAMATGPLQLWGVDKLDGACATIAGQIPCTDTGRLPVLREFNRRMRMRFREAGIVMGLPGYAVRVEGWPEAGVPANETALPNTV